MFPLRHIKDLQDKPLHELMYADCHGITKNTLGTAPVIFSLVQMYKPQTIVVIGSGAGVIPRILREAQIASGMEGGTTSLIDLGETMGALPEEIHNASSLFRTLYPEIKVFQGYSVPNGVQFVKEQLNGPIDILWIDGDHSYKGSSSDFKAYSSLVSDEGLIFFHDTYPQGYEPNPEPGQLLVPSWCGVHHTIANIQNDSQWEVLNFVATPKHALGCGFAIVKKRLV